MAQSWRALHGSLIKIAIRHRCFSMNFAINPEQRYWKTHFDGCFWEQLYFGNFSEWLLLNDSCKEFLRNSKLQIFHIFYCDVMLKRNEFFWIFLGKGLREKCKHTEIALNIIQKQYFSSNNPFSFHYSRIATLWISNQLLLKFSFFKGTLRP